MSKSTNLLVAFLLCMVLCVSPVSGKVLKVPSEHPTIDVAIGVASDGDTILIARGTYEHTTLNVNKRLILASDYINTKDQIDIGQTIIKATPAAEKQWFALNSKDSKIVGLTIIGNKNHTLKITSPYSEVLYCNFIGGGDQLSFEGGGGHIAHCDFDGAGDDAVDADDSVSYVVEYCTFNNVNEDADETRLQPKSGPLTTHIFRYNTVFKAGQSGIQLVDYAGDSKRTFQIYGNLFLNCEGSGVSMMANEHSDENHEGSDMVENVVVYNNTFYGCNHGMTLSPKTIVLNNIFSNCLKGVGKGKYITSDNDKTLVDYCLFFKNQTDYDSGIAKGSNILTEDPNFKDTKTFELSEGSPAIDAGTAKYAEVLKIPDGAYNGSAPDLGAKELVIRQGTVGSQDPSNGVVDVKQTQIITWLPSVFAASHEVYFGTDKDAVKNADTGSPEYKGTRDLGAETYDPGKLEWDNTYYWRVDEVEAGGTIHKGNVWSFTTANFLIVDDFESYNDLDPGDPESNRIFSVWIDGYDIPENGAIVGYCDEVWWQSWSKAVHGGAQSMDLYYDNSGTANYSEATANIANLEIDHDWTIEGVGVLSLWFYGDSNNAPEPMYVALNGSTVVNYDNPDALLIEDWTDWRIDLQAFADQGVDLTNINTISIGFGDKNNPQAGGGSSLVFFDDIRLYRPPPEPAP